MNKEKIIDIVAKDIKDNGVISKEIIKLVSENIIRGKEIASQIISIEPSSNIPSQ